MTETVTERKVGTMPEPEGRKEISPPEDGKTPADVSKVSSKEEEPRYSQKQLDQFIHMADSEAGRKHVALETERDSYKSRFVALEAELLDIKAERDKLQADTEELSSDDPRKFDLVKRDKELRVTQATLKKATEDLASEKQRTDERVKVAEETLLEISVWEIAGEYQSGDPVKLKDLCSTFGATTEESIRKVADAVWPKVGKQELHEKERLVLDSGDSRGGGELTEQDRLDARYPSMAKK